MVENGDNRPKITAVHICMSYEQTCTHERTGPLVVEFSERHGYRLEITSACKLGQQLKITFKVNESFLGGFIN